MRTGRGWIVPLVCALLLAAPHWAAGQQASPTGTAAASPPAPSIKGLQTFTGLSHEHVLGPVHYPQNPPAGGPHNPVWENCGFYDKPVPNEQAVHSQEHGAVWITYRPDLPAAQVKTLKRFARDNDYVLVSPYPGLPTPVVASAWGAQVRLDGAADPRLAQFIAYYANNGPERGGPCQGGSSETIPFATPGADTPASGTPATTPTS
ncbi:MAG TPA: DUF3105 domain-containing protein [Thermomicrobiales bacterium]|nr:DUF3105 domain-containing protein [Thermomicrobiales bacterium]